MRYLTVLVLCGASALVAAAQNYPPPVRSYPVPNQYYPDNSSALVRSWYQRYLNREGDPGGVATWVDSLRQGNAPEATLATILSSQEYLQKAGGTNEGLVQTLFLDLTGRRPTGGDYSYWLGRMHHEHRTDVIYDMLMRYPQNWQTAPTPVLSPDAGYDYRRPYQYYRDRDRD